MEILFHIYNSITKENGCSLMAGKKKRAIDGTGTIFHAFGILPLPNSYLIIGVVGIGGTN